MKKNLKLGIGMLVIALVAFASCEKGSSIDTVSIDDNPDTLPPSGHVPTPVLTGSIYFQAKINNEWYSLEDSINGYINTADSSFNGYCASDSSMYWEGQTSRFHNNSSTNYVEIKFLECLDTLHMPDRRDSMIYVATYPFGQAGAPLPGVEITFSDSNGTLWTTQAGSGQPSASSFTIQDTVLSGDTNSTFIMTGTTSATLYSGNNFILLRNGIFRARIGRKNL